MNTSSLTTSRYSLRTWKRWLSGAGVVGAGFRIASLNSCSSISFSSEMSITVR